MQKKLAFFLVLAMTLALLAVGTADQSVPLAGVGNARELGVTEAEIQELQEKFLE